VKLAGAESANVASLCRRFGISRKTGYKWLKRYSESGEEGLKDRSRRPQGSPVRTPAEMEKRVEELRNSHPAWGGRKVRRRLQDIDKEKGVSQEAEGSKIPSASTITSIFRRKKLLEGDGSGGVQKGNWKRFEKERPNEMWQMDFKGHFAINGGRRCHPLTVIDDHSRYNLTLRACGNENGETVKKQLLRAFDVYGLPESILCDNGGPWGTRGDGRGTRLAMWLLLCGIDVKHGRPYHPQTQGKDERFHQTLKSEVLKRTLIWRGLAHCQEEFDSWRGVYNHERPHEALGMDTPDTRYEVSERRIPEKLPVAEDFYLDDDVIRVVKSKGEITFRNVFYGVGEGLSGQKLGLRKVGERSWDVYFGWKKIGTVDESRLEGKQKGHYEKLAK